MDIIKRLEHLGHSFAGKRKEAVEQLQHDLCAVRYARQNQEAAELGKAAFGLYIGSEYDNIKLRHALVSIKAQIEAALEPSDDV